MPAPSDRSISGFFHSQHNPYYIYAPDYHQGSAGVRALHQLCHALNELGCEAYIAPGQKTLPKLRAPTLQPENIKNHFLAGKTPIAIYPETVTANIFGIPHVAYWLLNRPGRLTPKRSYENEILFHFSEWVLSPGMQSELLTLPLLDVSVFNNHDNPHDENRSVPCYYAHKYLSAGHEVPQDMKDRAVSLCQDIPRPPAELAAILRKSSVLYCYEETALMSEAILCGCPVVLVSSPFLKKEDWLDRWLPAGAGWEDEPEVLNRLRQETQGFRELYETTHRHCWVTVENFIAATHDRFTLSGQGRSKGGTCAETENFWNMSPENRAPHLSDFLESVSRLSIFSYFDHSSPVQQLAHWLDRTAAAASPLIEPTSPAAAPVTASNASPQLSFSDEARILEQLDAHMKAGQSDQATTLLMRLAAHGTLRWEVYETLGQIHAEQHRLDEAADVLLKGAALEFSSTHCLRKLAAVYAMQGESWRTLAACTNILKREPDDTELHLFVRDVLLSTSPRFDDISWLAPEWTGTVDALNSYRAQAHTARVLLDKLQDKARAVREQYHPLTGSRPSVSDEDDTLPTQEALLSEKPAPPPT